MKLVDQLLLSCVNSQDAAAVRKALERGADPNLVVDQVPLIVLASCSGEVEVVEALLAAGAKPNAVDEYGRTALIHMGWFGRGPEHAAIFDMLVKAGGDVNIADRRGKRALDYAVFFMNPAFTEKLVALGAQCTQGMRATMEQFRQDRDRSKG